MIIFNTDLDNTLIYSYKHNIGAHKRNVEIYRGREISFISEKTFHLLNALNRRMLIVPTTTRSIEQYERINLGIAQPKYALVCNGGILLENGRSDESWYRKSSELIYHCRPVMQQAALLLENEPHRYFQVRYIEQLFLFTKCTEAESVVCNLSAQLDCGQVDVFNNGDKVYVVPKALNKGNAITRLRNKLKPQTVIAAGDSAFDISMVLAADIGYVPKGFKETYGLLKSSVFEASGKALFSEEILNMCMHIVNEY